AAGDRHPSQRKRGTEAELVGGPAQHVFEDGHALALAPRASSPQYAASPRALARQASLRRRLSRTVNTPNTRTSQRKTTISRYPGGGSRAAAHPDQSSAARGGLPEPPRASALRSPAASRICLWGTNEGDLQRREAGTRSRPRTPARCRGRQRP